MGFILVTELGGKYHFSRHGKKNVFGKNRAQWDFTGSPVVENAPSHAGTRIQSLVRELRSCMLGIGKQKENKPEFIHDKKSCHNRNRGTASIFDSGYSLGKADLFKEAFLMVWGNGCDWINEKKMTIWLFPSLWRKKTSIKYTKM